MPREAVRAALIAAMVALPVGLFVMRLAGAPARVVAPLFWVVLGLLSVSLSVVVGGRFILLRRFEQGMEALRAGDYDGAIVAFADYLRFLDANPFFDRWHWLLLLTADAYSLREMTLCNLGYAYAQLGERGEAAAFYETVLALNSTNDVAIAALRVLQEEEVALAR